MIKLISLYIPILILLLSSCGIGKNITEKDLKTTSFMPNEVKLELQLEDFEYIGETEVSITYKKLFGFTLLNMINGKPANRNQINSIQLHGRSFIFIQPGMERALFDTHRLFPEADIIIPIYTLTERQNMFMASNIKKTLKVKVYKFKK